MRFLRPISVSIAVLSLGAVGANSDVPFPNYPEPDLPKMEPCAQRLPVPLPEKWAAVTLMAPYLYEGIFPLGAELRVGRFTYDAGVGAMRAAVYGVESNNVVDLLITHDRTWLLGGSWDRPTCLADWGTHLSVPGRVWQDNEAVCVGNHATAPTIRTGPKVDWWKQPSPIQERGAEGQAGDWFWFQSNGYPTRTFFWGQHPGLPAVLSDYAFSNFYEFESVDRTNLAELIAMCSAVEGLPVLDEKRRIATRNEPATRGGQPTAAGDLIPGLSYEACSGPDVKPPSWPREIYITSFSTAAKFATPRPISTSVYYDPAGPNLRTRLHKLVSDPPPPTEEFSDALLLDQSSYGIDFLANPPFTQLDCGEGPHTSLPGAPHPNWGERGNCRCMGVIKDNPVLSPERTTQVISCPLADYSGDTLFWMWYTVEAPPEPIVFLQTRADITIGTGLCLADYFHWTEPPPSPIPSGIFTVPAQSSCTFPPSSAPTPPPACLYCHNVSTNSGHGTSLWGF